MCVCVFVCACLYTCLYVFSEAVLLSRIYVHILLAIKQLYLHARLSPGYGGARRVLVRVTTCVYVCVHTRARSPVSVLEPPTPHTHTHTRVLSHIHKRALQRRSVLGVPTCTSICTSYRQTDRQTVYSYIKYRLLVSLWCWSRDNGQSLY